MIDFSTSATVLLVWGIVAHLLVDFLGQTEWMAINKAKRCKPRRLWVIHPAAYVHAWMHFAIQLLVFPFWAALLIGVAHFFIDLRWPVEWWSKLIRQTQPAGEQAVSWKDPHPLNVMDIGAEVRFWVDQVFHILVIAFAALLVG